MSQVTLLKFHPEALDELQAAVMWHERERTGYGRLFYETVQRRILQAMKFPKSGAPVLGFNPHHDVRRFIIGTFRYCIITANVENERMVFAIAHTSRNPGYWRRRVK